MALATSLIAQPAPSIVHDLRPGASGSSPTILGRLAGQTFLAANNGQSGAEPWVIRANNTSALLLDIHPGLGSSFPRARVATEDETRLYFTAYDGTDTHLWVTDGTSAGTHTIGPAGSFPGATGVASIGGLLFFDAIDPQHGRELWVSDGTPAGTRIVRDIHQGSSSSNPDHLIAFGDKVVFAASGVGDDRELWCSDGTEAGTQRIADILPGPGGSAPGPFVPLGARLLFPATTGTISGELGAQLWATDGTANGTVLVSDLGGATEPIHLFSTGDAVFFSATTTATGHELWISDGTSGGTALVRDIATGPFGSAPDRFCAVGNGVVFRADTPATGRELWFSDGTTSGTELLRDILPGPRGSLIGDITPVGGVEVYFAADDGEHGAEMWRTDGTDFGTVMAWDLRPGSGSSSPNSITLVNGRVYAAATGLLFGREIWRYRPGPTTQVLGAGCSQGVRPDIQAAPPGVGSMLRVEGNGGSAPIAFLFASVWPAQPVLIPGTPCLTYLDPLSASLCAMLPVQNGSWVFARPIPASAALSGIRMVMQAVIGPTSQTPGYDMTPGILAGIELHVVE